MDTWQLNGMDLQAHRPAVLHSEDGVARVIALALPAGEELQEHEVHEHAWLSVHQGTIEITENGNSATAPAGTLVHWLPKERRAIRASEDAVLVMMLAPWPGVGHPNLRSV